MKAKKALVPRKPGTSASGKKCMNDYESADRTQNLRYPLKKLRRQRLARARESSDRSSRSPTARN
jgi:hypothetical protein